MRRTFLILITGIYASSLLIPGAWAHQHKADATNMNSGTAVNIAERATQVTENVFSLGTAIDPVSHKTVEGYAIVHYRKAFEHKPNHGNGGGKPDHAGGGNGENTSDTSSCYDFIAREAKWRAQEPWTMNPANIAGLSESETFTILTNGVGKWESAAGMDILGAGSLTATPLVADQSAPDGVNEVLFGEISDSGAIGVTLVWGIFSGKPSNRELIEWDQIYDDRDFDWSLTGDPLAMDFDNIATHELGHTFGLADLYTSDCSEITMYGYATEGETKKRDLDAGDIAGMNALY